MTLRLHAKILFEKKIYKEHKNKKPEQNTP